MEKLNLDKRVYVRNLRSWAVYFTRSQGGAIKIPANWKTVMTVEEIQHQCFTGNKFFIGEDGKGSHATVFIEDRDTRISVGFELDPENAPEGAKIEEQLVLSDEQLTKIFDYKTFNTFKKRITELVQTESEKKYVAENCVRLGLNDYQKIKFVEELTGLPIKDA